MIDAVLAILSRRWCGWCNYKPDNWVERFLGADKNYGDPGSCAAGWRRVGWWLYTHGGLGAWRIGQWWHHEHH